MRGKVVRKNIPPKGQRPTIGKQANEDKSLPHCVISYIKQEVKANNSLYGALYDAYDGCGASRDVGEWIARNEDVFAKEWLKEKGVI